MDNIKVLTTYIKTLKVRELVEAIFDEFNPLALVTFKKGASSSGKYHPPVSNLPFGLANHTIVMIHAINRLSYFYQQIGLLTDVGADIVRGATVLHDAWKYTNLEKATSSDVNTDTIVVLGPDKIDLRKNLPHTTKSHGYVGHVIIQKYIENHSEELDKGDLFILNKMSEAVRYHMSKWCHSADEIAKAIKTRSLINRLVQEADMIASCKELFTFDGVQRASRI